MILDNILMISILLVFIGALLGGYLQRRRKDRVLKDVDGFHMTARRDGAAPVWGKAKVYPNALELLFTRPFINDHNHKLFSYIMFADKLASLLALYRYQDELTADNQRKRLKEVNKVINRGFAAKLMRQGVNFINTFRDAINESMGLMMSRFKGAGGASALLGSQNDRLKKISSQAVGMVGNSWDPVLEQYIGRRVIVELKPEGVELEEYAGVLKEYSKDWISLFDCRQSELSVLPLDDIERLTMQRLIDFTLTYAMQDDQVVLTLGMINRSNQQVQFEKLSAEHFSYSLEKTIAPGESMQWTIKNLPSELTEKLDQNSLPITVQMNAPNEATDDASQRMHSDNQPLADSQLPAINLSFFVIREVDVFLPRDIATLRHAGEYI